MVRPVPRIAALELTLQCPYRCRTCGSAAGRARSSELATEEWEAVVDALAELGCERVTLMGGEPLAHPDWVRIARHVVARNLEVEMVTSGAGLTPEVVATMVSLPFDSVTVSVDGTEAVHDAQRGVPGAFSCALNAIRTLHAQEMAVGVTTQLNQHTLPVLEPLAAQLQEAGALAWQVQHTLPTGRARTTELMLSAEQTPEVHHTLRTLASRRGLRPYLTDNVGYLSSDDVRLRTPMGMPTRAWAGCWAGIFAVGITSDGRVKGCLSIPDPHDEGSVREESLQQIWRDPRRFAYTRDFQPEVLHGACGDCVYGRLCRAGCTAMQLAVHGCLGTSTHCFRVHEPPRSPT